jgi:hypothetical protein
MSRDTTAGRFVNSELIEQKERNAHYAMIARNSDADLTSA